jgi:hypothetical protein
MWTLNFFKFYVPTMLPMCFHMFLKFPMCFHMFLKFPMCFHMFLKFPTCFQWCSLSCPICSPRLLPISPNSIPYNLSKVLSFSPIKQWQRRGITSWHRIFYYNEPQNKFFMGQSNWLITKREEKGKKPVKTPSNKYN